MAVKKLLRVDMIAVPDSTDVENQKIRIQHNQYVELVGNMFSFCCEDVNTAMDHAKHIVTLNQEGLFDNINIYREV